MKLSYPIPRVLASAGLTALLLAGWAQAGTLKEEWLAATDDRRLTLLDEYRGSGKPEALSFLVELLKYPDMRIKMGAANALRQWGPDAYSALFACLEDRETAWLGEAVLVDQERRVTPFLVRQLSSLLPTSRARAAAILGKGRDPEAVPPLLKLLEDPVREVRIQAILALGEMQDDRAINPLLRLFAEGNPLLSEYAIQALEGFGWQGAKKFKEALASEEPRIRSGAVQVLRRLRVPESLPDLVEALSDGSPQVRMAAVSALGQFKGQAAAEGLLLALRDPDDEVAETAVRNLGRMGAEVYSLVIGRLNDPDSRYRRNLVLVLRQAGDSSVVPPFIRLINDPDEAVRTYAVTALMELKDKRAVKPLVERLKVENEIQWLIAYALQSMSEDCADELLSAVGNDQFCYTRNLILLRMGEKAQDVLVERARKGTGTARLTAIALLGQLGDPSAAPVLESLIPDPEVGVLAASALTGLKATGWRILFAKAKGTPGVVQRNALSAIGSADLAAASFLLDALAMDDSSIREAAVRGLDRCGPGVVPLVGDRLAALSEEGFEAAIGVLCRVSDPSASGPLSCLLAPLPGKGCLEGDRFDRLRVAYAVRGSLSNLREQMKMEMTGGPPVAR